MYLSCNFSLLSKKHKNMLSSFGLSEESSFPTAAFVPVKSKNDNLVTENFYNLFLTFIL